MTKKLPPMPRGHSPLLEDKLATPIDRTKKAAKRVLTPKQWKFVQELVMGDGQVTMAEAAVRAGWSSGTAKEVARQLTNPEKNPHVVAAIQELRKDMAERFGTTMERHMRDLQRIRDLALQNGAYGAAVQAEYRRGQALGTIYIDRKEIRHGTIDSMSKDEVIRKLEELKRMYGDPGKIIDITPKDLDAAVDVKPPTELLEQAKPEEEPEAARPRWPSSETEEGYKLKQAYRESGYDDDAREQALSEIAGKPVRLPYHPD